MSIWNSEVTGRIGVSRYTYYFSLLDEKFLFSTPETDRVASMKELGWGKIAPATLSKWSS